MQHWFVYYRLDADAALALAPRLRAMQAELGANTGVAARLMRRTDGDASCTLLEVYEGIADAPAFGAALAAAVERTGLPAPLVAQRRTERFEEF